MKIKFYSLIILFLSLPLAMQAGSISGKLIDSKTKEVIDFANVAIFNAAGNALQKSAQTNKTGAFDIKDLSLGKYLVKISFVGYSSLELPIALNAKRSSVDFGSILLAANSTNLKEVNVMGQKAQMRFELDRKVFNVDQNIAAAGASASEILKNIPSVEVDVQGNVSLRNNSNVIIWINGRPSGLNEDNRAQVLEQMPAETIERIEIITNPSSKYSPEGSAGIINIVLKKDRKAGYYGSISGGADTFNGINSSFNINYNSKKWDLYANVGYRSNKMESTSSSDRNSWNSDKTQLYNLKSNSTGENEMGGFFSRMGATYHISEKDLLGGNLMINRFYRSSDSRINYISSLNGNAISPYWRAANNDGNFNMSSLAFDYTHIFDNQGHEIKASVEYNKMKLDNQNDITMASFAQRMNLDGGRDEWEVQLDYTYPINKDSKIEAGYKGEFSDRSSNTRSNLVNTDLNNEFNSNDKRNSLYFNYSGKVNKLTYQAGLRGEYNLMTNESYTYLSGIQTITPFNKKYPGLYPSFFLNYSLPKNNELQLNYTRRINRPHGRSMNPYRDVSDSTNISYGNPNLNPEYSNSLELNHIKTWESHTLSSSIFYRTTSDVIQPVSFIEDKIKYSTSANITNTKAAGFEFILKDRFFKVIDLTSTFNLYYSKLDPFSYKSLDYAGNESFSWSYRSILNMGLPKGWMMQCTGGYQSKKNIAQGEILPSWAVDAGIRKMLFERKFSLNLMVRDIFDSRDSRINSFGTNFTDYTKSKMGGRMYGFSLTYNFGTNTAQKKKPDTKRNDQNGNSDIMNGGEF